jgi:hypothetical protein
MQSVKITAKLFIAQGFHACHFGVLQRGMESCAGVRIGEQTELKSAAMAPERSISPKLLWKTDCCDALKSKCSNFSSKPKVLSMLVPTGILP